MKKLLSVILTLAIIFSFTSTIYGLDKGVERLDRDKQIYNNGDSYLINYDNTLARVFYGNNGIDIICQDRNIHFDSNFAVKKLCVLKDVNNDGYVDFATYQASDYGDNFFIISGKDGMTLYSYRFTRTGFDESAGIIEKNTFILKMLSHENKLFVVSNYDLYCFDLDSLSIQYKYSAKDNIWDIEIVDNQVVFVDQLGQIGFINIETGKQTHLKKLSDTYTVTIPYDLGEMDVYGNLWDLYYYNNTLYITAEDGYLYQYNCTDYTFEKSEIGVFDLEHFKTDAANRYNWAGSKVTYQATGLNDTNYKNYRIEAAYQQYLLISCFIKDVDCTEFDSENSCYVLYDCNKNEMVKLDNDFINSYSQACFVKENNASYVDILSVKEGDATYFSKFDLTGKEIETKKVSVDALNKNYTNGYKLSCVNDQLVIEVYNSGCCVYSLDYKFVKYTYVLQTTEYIGVVNDSILVAGNENGVIKTISSYNKDLSQVNWTTQFDYTDSKGLEEYDVADYNNDGVADIAGIVNVYDEYLTITRSIFVVVDGKTGAIIKDNSIPLYTYYNEKGKKVTMYLTASSIKVSKDFNRDGYSELIIDETNILNGKNLKLVGYVDNSIAFSGKALNVGDGNDDGFVDYVVVTDNKASLYTSKVKGFNVEYRLAKSINLDKANECQYYSYVLGDIDLDGYADIALSGTNKQGYQVYNVISSNTLSKIFTLCEKGVSASEAYTVLDYDFNNDGYNELFGFTDSRYCYVILSGKDGSILKCLSYNDKEDIIYSEGSDYYHPEYKIELNAYSEEYSKLFVINNGKQFIITKNYYDEDLWETVGSMLVYNTDNFEIEKEYRIANGYNNYTIYPFDNSEDYLIIDNGYLDMLFDVKSASIIASYSVLGKEFLMIDDSHMLEISQDDVVYIINTQKGYELLSEIPEKTNNYILNIKLKSEVEYSVFKIYDNGDLVASGDNDEFEIKLTEGQHTLSIEMDDLSGKTSKATYNIAVERQANKSLYLFVIGIIMLVSSIIISRYRKNYIKKQSKGVK